MHALDLHGLSPGICANDSGKEKVFSETSFWTHTWLILIVHIPCDEKCDISVDVQVLF